MDRINDLNIVSQKLLPTPEEVKDEINLTDESERTVVLCRKSICDILDGRDPRLLLVIGPCSIHDLNAARDYAARLTELSKQVHKRFLLIMRVYFEKPRTSVGWKGFINDPRLDDSFRIDEGLRKARELLLELAHMGIGAGTEVLDPLAPQYLVDLISWSAIGARTSESQTHREISSGLSMPVGIKNATNGSIEPAINALKAVGQPHHFLGVTTEGRCSVFHTKGNPYSHIVLRGGDRPNYNAYSISVCEKLLAEAGLSSNILVDCSHGNSLKDPNLQPVVFESCVDQLCDGNQSIVGMMLESNIHAGSQSIPADLSQLQYGVSVTDACMDWETTERLVIEGYARLEGVLEDRQQKRQEAAS